ncbi:MAG: hypothetical protein H9Q65_00725 [Spiroplasma ixodetis]|nr:hypothetical protein [Spiroplasma ixodetis]MBP1526492.1 hypothetical protein [Spiroplasma ixodetis]MBP1527767.1 hypothetical protein [Spiroplasma ixodetis]
MKQFLLTLSTVTTLTIASNTMFNSMMIVVQKNNIASKKKILPVIPIDQNKSLFNNLEWQHFLGLFFGRHLFLIFDRS